MQTLKFAVVGGRNPTRTAAPSHPTRTAGSRQPPPPREPEDRLLQLQGYFGPSSFVAAQGVDFWKRALESLGCDWSLLIRVMLRYEFHQQARHCPDEDARWMVRYTVERLQTAGLFPDLDAETVDRLCEIN